MKQEINRLYENKWAISIISGVLLGLSFPPFPFPFLIIPGFLALFRLMQLTSTGKELAYVSYPGLVIWNIITTYWLSFATVAGGIASILANAALMTIPLGLIRYVHYRFQSNVISTLLVAALWVSYEFLHLRWDLSWPWLTLGNAFAISVPIIQFISITGVLGISFWLISIAYLLFRWVNSERKSILVATILVLIIPSGGSFLYYLNYTPEYEQTMETAILQPNYDSYQELASYPDAITPLRELLDQTETVITDQTEVIFWPENALQDNIRQDLRDDLVVAIDNRVSEWDIPLITGTAYVVLYDDQNAPQLARGTFQGRSFNIYNAAVAFEPGAATNQHYKKIELVPVVERIPFVKTIARLDIFTFLDWGNIAGYGQGNKHTLFDINGTQVPALICYDSVYPETVGTFVDDGANFITVITNDGWWGNTSGHIQHFDYARLRAIENRRAVLRSANNGISGVILPNGDVEVRTEYWTKDGFVYDVPLKENKTIYTRYGDWIGRLSVAGVIIFFISTGWRRLKEVKM